MLDLVLYFHVLQSDLLIKNEKLISKRLVFKITVTATLLQSGDFKRFNENRRNNFVNDMEWLLVKWLSVGPVCEVLSQSCVFAGLFFHAGLSLG